MFAEMPVFDETTKPSEAVRAALLWAIAEVEAAIDPAFIDDTRYLRSKQQFAARRGTTTATLYFSGSKWNGTGYGIWLMAGMAIRDSELGQWRRAHPAEAGDTGDFLDHVRLVRESDTMLWQHPSTTPNRFAGRGLPDLPRFILRTLIDAFVAYSSPLAALNTVPAGHLDAKNVAAFAEWALARGSSEDAADIVRIAADRRPILEEYLPAVAARLQLTAVAEDGPPAVVFGSE